MTARFKAGDVVRLRSERRSEVLLTVVNTFGWWANDAVYAHGSPDGYLYVCQWQGHDDVIRAVHLREEALEQAP